MVLAIVLILEHVIAFVRHLQSELKSGVVFSS